MKLACTSVGLVSVAVGISALGACGGSTTGDGNSGVGGGAGSISVVGNGGTISTIGAGGGAGNSGGSSINADAACVSNVQEGEAIPVNLVFLVDRSTSMTCPLGAAGQNCTNGVNNAMPPD